MHWNDKLGDKFVLACDWYVKFLFRSSVGQELSVRHSSSFFGFESGHVTTRLQELLDHSLLNLNIVDKRDGSSWPD